MKPKVFVASSKESLQVAGAIQENMEHFAEVTVWTQNVFEPSTYALESLDGIFGRVDFGIFILGADDTVVIRGKECKSPRDNVLLEMGMSIAKLGRERTFAIVPRGQDSLHLPSDYFGVIPVTFEPARQDSNLSAALGTACNRIIPAVNKLGPLNRDAETELYARIKKLLELTLVEIAEATGVRAQDIGTHFWRVAHQDDVVNPVLVRKARARIPDIASSGARSWAKGEGVVGQCWQSMTDIWVDLTDPQYQNASEPSWDKLPNSVRMGQSYQSFRETTRHFKAIFAIPVASGEDFFGAISVNFERDCDVLSAAIWTSDVRKIVRRAAAFSYILLE